MAVDRGLRNREAFSNAVDKRILAAFKEHSRKTKVPISKMLDEALEDYLKKYKVKY